MRWSLPAIFTAHPANCDGDFYVVDGCCTACGVPEAEAPEVFGWVGKPDDWHCVVTKQPQTMESVDRTLAAMWAAELDCIRYRGNNPDIGRRLVEMGHAGLCDLPPPNEAVLRVRSHVSFRTINGVVLSDPLQVAQDFVNYFKNSERAYSNTMPVRVLRGGASVQISWYKENYHSVEFKSLHDGGWLGITKPSKPSAGVGLSRIVDMWLRAAERFHDIHWFSVDQWQAGGPYQSTVI